MTTTHFTPGTVIESTWLNDVDEAVYTTVPSHTSAIATKAASGANTDITSLSGKQVSALALNGANTDITSLSGKQVSALALNGANTDITSLSGKQVSALALNGANTDITSLSALTEPTGDRNYLINGDMRVGQRGNAVFTSSNNLYGRVDRWLISISGTTVSAIGSQASGLSWLKSGYAVQVGNVITTGATTISCTQRIEALSAASLKGKTVTFSGKVYQSSGSTQTLTVYISKATAGVDNWGTSSVISATTISVPNNTAVPFTYDVTLGASDATNGISVGMSYYSLGAQSTTQFYFGECQLEEGFVTTPFKSRPYAHELELCQRYYQTLSFRIRSQNADSAYQWFTFPTQMRVAPTVTIGSFIYSNGSSGAIQNQNVYGVECSFYASAISGYMSATYTASAEL